MNNTIPAVDRTLMLLEALSLAPATQAELSERLSITMSSTYRILTTLALRGWVKKGEGGVYSLAGGILGLLHGFTGDAAVLERARHQVLRISSEWGIACKLSLRCGAEQLTDFRAEPRGPVALTGEPGSRFPVIEGSVGAALLADETESTLLRLAENCSEEIPERHDPELLRAAVREVRARGTVLNARANRWHIAALSVPLRNASERICGALSVIGNAEDFAGDKRTLWETRLKDAASLCLKEQR